MRLAIALVIAGIPAVALASGDRYGPDLSSRRGVVVQPAYPAAAYASQAYAPAAPMPEAYAPTDRPPVAAPSMRVAAPMRIAMR